MARGAKSALGAPSSKTAAEFFTEHQHIAGFDNVIDWAVTFLLDKRQKRGDERVSCVLCYMCCVWLGWEGAVYFCARAGGELAGRERFCCNDLRRHSRSLVHR